jgi:hypothetical protein
VKKNDDSRRAYLVNYGQAGFLGRFLAATGYSRDDRVVVRSERGIELGTILCEAGAVGPDPAGEVIRSATDADEGMAREFRRRLPVVLSDAQSLADSLDLPLQFLDGEILLDGREAILQAVHWADCDATPVFEQLSARHGLLVKLADLTAAPKPAAKTCDVCGDEKSGCDSCGTGGGCSSGSCSKGSVKSADDLTAYFAGLRKQMETAADRVSLH